MAEKRPIPGYITGCADQEFVRRSIVRATSWSQLFTTSDEATQDFLTRIVIPTRSQCEQYGTLRDYRVDTHDEGDVHTLFLTTPGKYHTFQKRANTGDVVIRYHGDEEIKETRIIPGIGNIDHSFTSRNTYLPSSDVIARIVTKGPSGVAGVDFESLRALLNGQYATQRAEEIFLLNGFLPQRIGHRIYAHHALALQARVMQGYNLA